MSVQSKIDGIKQAKSNIASSIEAKGIAVPTDTKLGEMSSLIADISQGTGDMQKSVYDTDDDGIVEQADTITAGEANPITNPLHLDNFLISTSSAYAIIYNADTSFRIMSYGEGSSRASFVTDDNYLYVNANGGRGCRIRLNNGEKNAITIAASTGYVSLNQNVNSTTTNAANVYMGISGDNAGRIFRSTSLKSAKTDINDITEEEALTAFNLRPVSFRGKIKGVDDHKQYGFIAEEVNEVLPPLASIEDGKLNGVEYERITAILLKQNQMLKNDLDLMKEELKTLKKGDE